ncbi:MAG: cysteine desulfurase family protein [Dehalococcoidales bacterium]|nr:cysteine desulfurase family protein [Dehalococcoidales bacterium]
MSEIYLDNCATTQPYPEVIDKMITVLRENWGNPSSLHQKGLLSKSSLDTARMQVAQAIDVHDDEICFTSGGTESDNLAILGACLANREKGNHIITTAIEHAAVIKPIRELKRRGWKVDYIPVPDGYLNLRVLADAVTEKTALVSVMLVNNEVGSIFPVQEVRQILNNKGSCALLHCDAVQGFGKIPFTAASLGADLISVSSHKIHGPKGAGALYIKRGTKIQAQSFGGGQEKGLRSGTEATQAIVGFGEAVLITFTHREINMLHMYELRRYCLAALNTAFPDVQINSPSDGSPYIVNVSFPMVRSKDLVKYLSEHGIYISSAAACKSNHTRGPSILESLGVSREMANSALRISFSANNTLPEIDELIRWIVEYRRTLSPV